MKHLTLTIAIAISSAALACTSQSSAPTGGDSTTTPAEPKVCDPLVVDASPIVLGPLVGAGRAKDGTVYVVDRAANGYELRAFVSDGTTLRRRKVYGTGESGGVYMLMLSDDPTNGLQVRIESNSDCTPTRMGVFVGPPDPKTKSFEIGVQGEELELVSATDLASFTLVDLATVRIMYAATTHDNRYFIATAPEVDYSTDKIRVFFGPKDRVLQRKVHSVNTDSSQHLEIDVDGGRTKVQLNYCNSWEGWGHSRLEGGANAPLFPIPGSPGGLQCPSFVDAGEASDAGADAAAGAPALPTKPKEAAELVAGLRFYCL